jgi:V/A-type H+-transporting ATPase subunit I
VFKPLPMQRVTLQVLREDAPGAALVLAHCGVFNPDVVAGLEEELPELPGTHYRELCRSAQTRLDKILGHRPERLEMPPAALRVVEEAELEQLNKELGKLWTECSQCEEDQRRVEEERKTVDQLSASLKNFVALDIDLNLLQGERLFLDLHVGTIPQENLRRVQEAVNLTEYIVQEFHSTEEGTCYVIVAGPKGHLKSQEEVQRLLEAAGFRSLPMPSEFMDYPRKVKEELTMRFRRSEATQRELSARIHRRLAEEHEFVVRAAQTLALAQPYADLAGNLRGRGGLAVVSGWVPRHETDRLRQVLEERLTYPFVLDKREPIPEERSSVPSALRHHPLLHPFVTLVKTYGVPRYGEFDPTSLFALTYVAMFGMMFGDIGHGAVIAGAGWFFRRVLGSFVPLIIAAGISSVIFGFLYGSIFGYEHVIPALWMAPLSDPILMLVIALVWGIAFILVAITLTVRNRLAEGRYLEAVLDNKGIMGMLFYVGMLYAAYRVASTGELGTWERAAVLVPLAFILGYFWYESKVPVGERILVVFIEGFETVVSYVSNTLSFLRVAAFSLNHAALALAVFALAGMMDTAGHWITVVLGNVFILVLEGAIVAIQVLRLEYYEGFSRFFSGDGKEFRPLTLAPEITQQR